MSAKFSETEHVTYDLQTDTLAEVAEIIAGMEEAAKTEWFPQYSFTAAGQQLATADVTVGTRMTMPLWSGCDSAPDADQREWYRFLAALGAHEQGHLDLVRQHLSNIDERLVGQSPAGASRLWDDGLAALHSASDSYDRDTDHGRSQGTIIKVSGVTAEAD